MSHIIFGLLSLTLLAFQTFLELKCSLIVSKIAKRINKGTKPRREEILVNYCEPRKFLLCDFEG